MKTVTFDDMDSYADFGLIRSAVTIGSPSPKTKTVDVEGADGSIDLTEYFGEVLYENREISMDFQAVEKPDLDAWLVSDYGELERDGDGYAVRGETRHNLWVNPSGTIEGVTVTSNDDGSIAVSGTASANAYAFKPSYVLKPSTAYFFGVDKELPDNLTVYIEKANSAGYIGLNKDKRSTVFTAKSDVSQVTFGVSVSKGAAVSGTYRVMLREATTDEIAAAQHTASTLQEGGTADLPQDYPVTLPTDPSVYADAGTFEWCKPGINGVEPEAIVTAGNNMLPANPGEYKPNRTGVTAEVDGDSVIVNAENVGSYAYASINIADIVRGKTVSFGLTKSEVIDGSGYPVMQVNYNVDGVNNYKAVGNLTSIYFPSHVSNAVLAFYCNNSVDSGITGSVRYEKPFMRLDGGESFSQFTGFEPTPIDMQGHALYEIGDARDVLHVDGTGAASIYSSCVRKSVKESDWILRQSGYSDDGGDLYYCALDEASVKEVYDNCACDRYYTTILSTPAQPTNSIRTSSDGTRLYVVVAAGTKPVACEVVYTIAEPQTVDLGTVYIETKRDFHSIFRKVYNELHGKRARITLSENPAAYYIGRLTVDEWKTNERTGAINIAADCEPYWYRARETVAFVTVNGTKAQRFRNIRKRVVPVFELSAPMKISNGAQQFDASAGTWSDSRLYFGQGETELTFTGTGTVKVTYQERGL